MTATTATTYEWCYGDADECGHAEQAAYYASLTPTERLEDERLIAAYVAEHEDDPY